MGRFTSVPAQLSRSGGRRGVESDPSVHAGFHHELVGVVLERPAIESAVDLNRAKARLGEQSPQIRRVEVGQPQIVKRASRRVPSGPYSSSRTCWRFRANTKFEIPTRRAPGFSAKLTRRRTLRIFLQAAESSPPQAASAQGPGHSTAGPKWRFVKARPEPDFRYFSNRTASLSLGNSSATTRDHGRCMTVWPVRLRLCHSTRSRTSLVIPT